MTLCRSDQYDLVIVGAGMVGASLACILEQADLPDSLRILLVEASPIDLKKPPAQPSFDARSTVLSHGTVQYLKDLGLWTALEQQAEPICHIHVSDQGKYGTVNMQSADMVVDGLGWVVENRLLGGLFNPRLAAAQKIELCSSVKVASVTPRRDGMVVEITHEQDSAIITTPLVVLAEGGRSGLCEKMGIHRAHEDYNQAAIIANVAFSKPHENVAFERFTRKGPLALLPLPTLEGEHRAALVWTQDSEHVDDLLSLPNTDFLGRLQKEFGSRLGSFTRVGKRHAYPLSLDHAEEQVRPGLVLLGNVAHSLHPVAGQGFNLAFRDTMKLAQILVRTFQQGSSPGAVAVLHEYQQAVSKDQDRTVAFSHYMTRLFSTENSAAVWVRKFGLFSIDLLMPLKKAFARRAMGQGEKKVSLGRHA